MSLRICDRQQIGVIHATGPDAESFLQGQLSQDIGRATSSLSVLAGWHDARGRLQALFRVWRHQEFIVMATASEIIGDVTEQLNRYKMRANLTLTPREDWRTVSVLTLPSRSGPDQASEERGKLVFAETLNGVAHNNGFDSIRITQNQHHLYGPQHAFSGLRLDNNPETTLALAQADEIRAGIPLIGRALAARFIPHMLNLEILNAIAFDKGCYPGQEIIARTENLGTVKRRARAFALQGKTLAAPGTALIGATGEQVGTVVNCAADGDNACVLLAVVQLDALSAPLHLEGHLDQPLQKLKMPFQ